MTPSASGTSGPGMSWPCPIHPISVLPARIARVGSWRLVDHDRAEADAQVPPLRDAVAEHLDPERMQGLCPHSSRPPQGGTVHACHDVDPGLARLGDQLDVLDLGIERDPHRRRHRGAGVVRDEDPRRDGRHRVIVGHLDEGYDIAQSQRDSAQLETHRAGDADRRQTR